MNFHGTEYFMDVLDADAAEVEVRWLGLVDYDEALQLQNQIHQKIIHLRQRKMVILGLEHPSVITLGKRSNPQDDLNLSQSQYEDRQILIRQTDRGGFATLHNPGQLVIYPIFNLERFGWGLKEYVSTFQGTIRDQIKSYSIDCYCSVEDPGVFTQTGKVASVGLRIHQQTTMHGASINIQNNLNEFDLLNPCGVKQRVMDKLSNYHQVTTQDFFNSWVQLFISKIGNRSDICG